MLNVLSLALKIVVASLICGVCLSYFDIRLEDVLWKLGLSKEEFLEWLEQAAAWALPNLMVGSFFVVPIWLLTLLLRPNGRRED